MISKKVKGYLHILRVRVKITFLREPLAVSRRILSSHKLTIFNRDMLVNNNLDMSLDDQMPAGSELGGFLKIICQREPACSAGTENCITDEK